MTKKRILMTCSTMALIACMALSTLAIASAQPTQFSDVPAAHWAYKPVNELSALSIVGGYPDGTFRPGNKLTIAECLTLVVRGVIHANSLIKMEDATQGHWASPYIETAKARGIFYDSDLTGSQTIGSPASRAQMAVFIDRALDGQDYSEFKNPGVNGTLIQELYGYETKFSDAYEAFKGGKLTLEEMTAITHLYMLGIVAGYPDGTYGYADTISRAETATIIYRFINPAGTEHGAFPGQGGGTEESGQEAGQPAEQKNNGISLTLEDVKAFGLPEKWDIAKPYVSYDDDFIMQALNSKAELAGDDINSAVIAGVLEGTGLVLESSDELNARAQYGVLAGVEHGISWMDTMMNWNEMPLPDMSLYISNTCYADSSKESVRTIEEAYAFGLEFSKYIQKVWFYAEESPEWTDIGAALAYMDGETFIVVAFN